MAMATSAHLPDKDEVVGLALSLTLWGCSLPMFAGTIFVLCKRRPCSWMNTINLVIAILLFIISTFRIVVNSQFILGKFLDVDENEVLTIPTTSRSSFHRETLISSITCSLQIMLGDAVVIYRCYVVWQSHRIISVPIILWCGTLASFIGGIYYTAELQPGSRSLFTSDAGRWRAAFFYLTLLTNLLSTGLLAFRIRQIHISLSRTPGSVMRSTIYPIMLVIVDAGILYSALLLTTVITLSLKSTFTFLMGDIIVPTVSIIFYLVIMRIAAAKSSLEPQSSPQDGGEETSCQTRTTNARPQLPYINSSFIAIPLPESEDSRGDSNAEERV